MTPPGLLGAAVLFWGWQTGLWPFALLLAPLLELARVSAWRWDISRRDVHRISDLCSVVFAGMAIYAFATAGGRTPGAPSAFARLFQWLPLALAPLVACQLYGATGRLETSTLFWTLRRRAQRPGAPPPSTIDLSYVYVAVCVLSASAANGGGPSFHAGLCLLTAWALWPRRSPRVSVTVWIALLVVAVAAGYAGQVGLRVLQQRIEHLVLEYVLSVRDDSDPFRSTTSLGALGRLKLSDRVVLRVTPHDAFRAPLLLRDATYNFYHAGSWYAVDAHFTSVQPEGDGETWKLDPRDAHDRRLTVSAYLRGGRGVLPLPHDAFEIDGLTVVALGKNRLGTVKVEEGTGLVTYTALSASGAAADGPPEAADVRLPVREAGFVGSIVDDLGLAALPPARAVAAIQAYFARGFRYSTWTSAESRAPGRALEDFLLHARTGHCEYFATATALLLRAAGIPARYAVGYSVQEWSRLEGAYVARARHAHAWARAWVDGRWIDVDTTPPAWVEEERGSAAWQIVGDAWEWGAFQFSRWRFGTGGDGVTRYLVLLLAPLVSVVAWRIYARTRRARRAPRSEPTVTRVVNRAADSEFYLIERRLADAGVERRASEPAAAWVRRLATGAGFEDAAVGARSSVGALAEIVVLHDRYRFDPAGLSARERQLLREKATAWLDAHARESAGDPRA
jgi:transglutaminase-like putative cysteine protease